MKKEERKTEDWWYCDNIVHPKHKGQIGLLRMSEPRVFVLIRDYADAYFADFEEFRDHVAEVNFFDPSERKGADLEEILLDAWNFMAMQEEEEERRYGSDESFI